MGKVFDKFLNILGFEVVEEEDEPQELLPVLKNEEKPDPNWYEKYEKKFTKRQWKDELNSVPSGYSAKMVVCRPDNFNDIRQVADNLKERHSVVVDLTELDVEQAQRVLDYLSGVVFAIGGNASKVGSGIFLFTPSNVSIEGAVDLVLTDDKELQKETVLNEELNSLFKTASA
ncbi:cell division inhibitor SepF [Desulfohalotomaculum tongense]|nr:cell division protein SepF [Desulforadius tongensis]MBM7855994.1 cell division inhibitor SepF [Desulforadius tongensis]